MKVTKVGIALIQGWEKLRLNVYQDAAGYDTIGWGHLIKPDESFKIITKVQADELFAKDLDIFEEVVSQLVTIPILPLQFDAMVSLSYNIGGGNFQRSSVLSKINSGLEEEVPKHFADWRKSGGRVLRGLVRRRTLEAQIFVDANLGEAWGLQFLESYFPK